MPTAKKDDTPDVKPDDEAGVYAVAYPDDEFVTGIDGLVITQSGTPIPAANLDAVKKAAADNLVTIKKVG